MAEDKLHTAARSCSSTLSLFLIVSSAALSCPSMHGSWELILFSLGTPSLLVVALHNTGNNYACHKIGVCGAETLHTQTLVQAVAKPGSYDDKGYKGVV
eukprot:scaffold149886_cov16-Tisochrysis_lutea.AAC.1